VDIEKAPNWPRRPLAACCAAIVILPSLFWFGHPTHLRIGVNHSPPFNFRRPNGEFSGFAVDVLNEAVRRAGNYSVEWVFLDSPPDTPLSNGVVDLWPYLTVIESRRQHFHMTKPWWKTDTALVSTESRPVRSLADLAGTTVAFGANGSAWPGPCLGSPGSDIGSSPP